MQARLAGETILHYFSIELIVTSPMKRATETAQLIADKITLPPEKLVMLDDLRERDLGSLEGLDYARAPQHNGNYEDVEKAPGIEPIAHLYARAECVLDQLRRRPETHILLVTHNGLGRMLKTVIAGGQPLDLYKQARLENAVVYPLPDDIGDNHN